MNYRVQPIGGIFRTIIGILLSLLMLIMLGAFLVGGLLGQS